MMSPQLKLIALDADDLAVISASMCRMPACRPRTSSGGRARSGWWSAWSRLDWEQTLEGEAEPRRLVAAALRFDRVLACKSRNIDLAAPDKLLDLLGIEFPPGTAATRSPAAARCCCLPKAAPSASTWNAWNAS